MLRSNPFFDQTNPLVTGDPSAWSQAILILVLIVGILWALPRILNPTSRRSRRASTYRAPAPAQTARQNPEQKAPLGSIFQQAGLRDPAQQLHAVSLTGFQTVPLLNKSEARLLPALEDCVKSHGQGHRLMAQTSLGEILRPVGADLSEKIRDDAFFSINAKRLDFAVFNRFGYLVVAIEYQGHGHYHTQSFMRDAVKREALRKAGVPFLELPAEITPQDAAERLREALQDSVQAKTA